MALMMDWMTIEYYNTDRLHFSLDMSNYETPMMAFHKRKATPMR